MKKYIIHITDAGNTSDKLTVDVVIDIETFEELPRVSLKICSGYFELRKNEKLQIHKTPKEGYGDMYYLYIDDMNDTDLGFMQFSFLREVNKPKLTTLE